LLAAFAVLMVITGVQVANQWHATLAACGAPGDRYWAFQGIETGIFLALAAVLIAVTAVTLLRRDA
jgi:hypothetical protein